MKKTKSKSNLKKVRKKIYNISKKIGDKTGVDLPYYVENGFWVILGQIVTVLVGLGTWSIFTHYLSKEILGQYQFVLSTITLISLVSLPGLNTAISQSVARGFDGSYSIAVKQSFKWSLLGIPVLWGISTYFYYLKEDLTLSVCFLMSSFFFPFIYAPNTWQAFLQGKSYFNRLAQWNITQNLIQNSLLIILVITFSKVVFGIVIGYLIFVSGFNIFWYFKSKQLIENDKNDKDTLNYGLFITKTQILSIIVQHFDKIIIGFFDIEMLAIYVIALKMLDMIKGMCKSTFTITFPKFAKNAIQLSKTHLILLLLVGFSISSIFYFTIDLIVINLYTDKFIASATFFKKIIWISILYLPYFLFVQKVSAQKEKKKIIQLRTIPPLLAIIIPVGVFVLTQNIEFLVLSKVYISFGSAFIILLKK